LKERKRGEKIKLEKREGEGSGGAGCSARRLPLLNLDGVKLKN
jgi:hypothetical protein